MTYRNIFFSLLLSVFCCVPSPVFSGMMMPNMEDFEKELAEANRAIEEYVASLPQAEQDEFNRQVEEMSRMFENMSEDEFEQFLGEMFADDSMMMEPNPFDTVQAIQPEEIVEVALSAEDKQKVETALAIIDDIIKQSNLFMVIINSSSDLPERVNTWAKKNDIPHWQTGTDWLKFKSELDTFIQKLYRSEEQDLTTRKYKYLLELIADEALYNNLIQLRTELNRLVPSIEIPEFGLEKLSSESKKTIKDILGKYTESFYLLEIPKTLDTLFEKYAPEEEKIRAAEEAATKRAQESARMTRTPASKTEAGYEDMGYGDYYGGYDNYYSPYGDYGDYGYSPYDNYGYGNDYGYGNESGSRSGSGKSGGGNAGGGGSSKEKGANEEESKDKKGKKPSKEQFTPNYELDKAVFSIKKDLEDIKSALSETNPETEEERPTKLANLYEHITGDEKIDEILAGYVLPRVVDKKISDISLALKKIDAKKLNQEDLAHYQKEVGKLFTDYKEDLETIYNAINHFEQKTEEEEPKPAAPAAENAPEIVDVKTLSPLKRWAYFGGDASEITDEEEAKLKETITPVSLFEIRDNIKKLLDDVKKFTSKKAEAPKKPAPKRPEPEVEADTISSLLDEEE
jgi:hypothetical protein